MTDLLGHVFCACLFAGQILITRRSAWGWLLHLVGDVGWFILGLCLGLTCIWAWGAVFIAIDVRGFLAWRGPTEVPPIEDTRPETDEDDPRPHCFDGPF